MTDKNLETQTMKTPAADGRRAPDKPQRRPWHAPVLYVRGVEAVTQHGNPKFKKDGQNFRS
jgi:hypothetical protein